MAPYNRRCGPGRSDSLRMGQVGGNQGPGRSQRGPQAMTRALAAVLLALSMAGCTAARLAWRAGPTDCRDPQGVHVPCPQAWP